MNAAGKTVYDAAARKKLHDLSLKLTGPFMS
jgi:hypothetical protein